MSAFKTRQITSATFVEFDVLYSTFLSDCKRRIVCVKVVKNHGLGSAVGALYPVTVVGHAGSDDIADYSYTENRVNVQVTDPRKASDE